MNAKLKRYIPVLFWLIIIFLLCMFFTNDFGIVDLHKTSLIVAVGIDRAEDEVQVTAQVAVPQPSQSGDNINYVEIQGSGQTVADALNEINVKTGTYPRLLFCKLILLGENCQSEELFRMLGCLYRRNYSELTALVAMCKGRAQDMLSLPATISPENSTAIQKALSEELKRSANVSSANLKSIAESNYSVSKACYMPFVEANVQGTSESGGNGDNVGGEEGNQGGGQGGESGGSGGGQGGESGGSGGGQSGGQSGQMEFTARKTAIFADGKFAGLLDEQESFALNILNSDIRVAVTPCTVDDIHYTVGLRGVNGGVKLKITDGEPELQVGFKAKAQVQGVKAVLDPYSVRNDDVVKPEVLRGAEEEVRARFVRLIEKCVDFNCDVLGVRQLLHKYNYKYFEELKDDILSRMKVSFDVKIESLN